MINNKRINQGVHLGRKRGGLEKIIKIKVDINGEGHLSFASVASYCASGWRILCHCRARDTE